MIRSILAVAAVVFSIGGVQAAETLPRFLYECDLTDTENSKGWISPKIAVVSGGDGVVKVIDKIVLGVNKEPLAATVLRNNTKRLIVKWTIDGAPTRSGRSYHNFDYRASIDKASAQIELTARLRHFDTGLRSGGTCRLRDQ